MKDRPQRHADDAERDHRRRVAVHDRLNLRVDPIDLAVDETFEIGGAAPRIDRVAVEIEFHDITSGDQRWRHASRQQEAARVLVVPGTDMAKAVEYTLTCEDAIGGDEVLDQLRTRRTQRRRRHFDSSWPGR